MKEFEISLDKKAKTGTVLIFVIITMVLISFIPRLENGDTRSIVLFVIIIVFDIAVFLLPYLYRPLKYIVTENELIIKRLIKPVVIDLSEIKKITPLSREDMIGTIRVFGSGGVFGYFGKFRNKRYGMMTLYTTRTDNRVHILTSEGKNIILSPDNVDEFIKAVESKIAKEK